MNWQSVTALVVTGVIVGLIVYDLVAFARGGNQATISRVLLDVSKGVGGFALCFVFGLGVLVGHLFLPQRDEPKGPPAA